MRSTEVALSFVMYDGSEESMPSLGARCVVYTGTKNLKGIFFLKKTGKKYWWECVITQREAPLAAGQAWLCLDSPALGKLLEAL